MDPPAYGRRPSHIVAGAGHVSVRAGAVSTAVSMPVSEPVSAAGVLAAAPLEW